jgi:hypothetical protein
LHCKVLCVSYRNRKNSLVAFLTILRYRMAGETGGTDD